MKILLIGDYSHVHSTLAEGLRCLGHQVIVVSNGDFWKNYPRDIDLSRHDYSKWGGLRYYAKLLSLLPKFRGFDVVQLISPMFLELKAERILPIYKYLQRNNRTIFLGANGIDWFWIYSCTKTKSLKYSDFNIGTNLRNTKETTLWIQDWMGTFRERMNKYMAETCDGIIPGLYEYWQAYQPFHPTKNHFIPYPMKLDEESSQKVFTAEKRKLRIFIGINKTRSTYKGTDIMLSAAQAVEKKHKEQVELIVVENIPFEKYQNIMNGCDAILDQLYSYTPSMNALLAMSKGLICIGGGEPENYEIIHEYQLRPIINVRPSYESVYTALEKLIANQQKIPLLKAESIAYIRKHHEYIKVAKQYEQLYLATLNARKL